MDFTKKKRIKIILIIDYRQNFFFIIDSDEINFMFECIEK